MRDFTLVDLVRQFHQTWMQRLVLMLSVATLIVLGQPSYTHAYEGFGANTVGGEGQPFYHVTNLNDSGAGSLRDGLSKGNRYIVFDVGGVIEASSRISVMGANITLDGFTAPSPGITLKNFGLRIAGGKGAHDVIVRGLRVHIVDDVPGTEDAITISGGAYNVVIDHVSLRGASDENIGINNARDITISWSILADPLAPRSTNMLITNKANRISVHHNVFLEGRRRNPWISWLEDGSNKTNEAPEIQADVRNNVLWHVSNENSGHGIVVFGGGKANVVNNFFKATEGLSENGQKRVIVVCGASGITVEDLEFCGTRPDFPPGRAYVAGNVSADGWTQEINNKGTETEPFAAAAVATTDACSAANQVLSGAGAEPLDLLDQADLSQITLIPCVGPAAQLQVNPHELDFSFVIGGQPPAAKNLRVTDSNGEGLSWNVTDIGGAWISVAPTSGTAPADVAVGVDVSVLPVGSSLGTIAVQAPASNDPPIIVPVTVTVSENTIPTIVSPNPGGVLPGATVTFQWTANGANIKKWQLYIGSSQGEKDLYKGDKLAGSTLSETVAGLPLDETPVWVRLRFNIDGDWNAADFQYTAAMG